MLPFLAGHVYPNLRPDILETGLPGGLAGLRFRVEGFRFRVLGILGKFYPIRRVSGFQTKPSRRVGLRLTACKTQRLGLCKA